MTDDISGHPFILTIERMLVMHPNLTPAEKRALQEWEAINLGAGGKGTTDWPGWKSVAARLSH